MRMEIFVERFQVWQQNAETCEDACRWLSSLLAHVSLPLVNSPVAVLRRTHEPSKDLAALWTINESRGCCSLHARPIYARCPPDTDSDRLAQSGGPPPTDQAVAG